MDRILQYLKKIVGIGILFKNNNKLDGEVYIYVDNAWCIVDRHSTSRYFTFLGGNLIIGHSKK